MLRERTNASDPEVVALAALGWVLGEPDRAARLLGLTGLTPEDLRTRLGDRALLGAVLAFVLAHEPDLLACAEATGISPAVIAETARVLGA